MHSFTKVNCFLFKTRGNLEHARYINSSVYFLPNNPENGGVITILYKQ